MDSRGWLRSRALLGQPKGSRLQQIVIFPRLKTTVAALHEPSTQFRTGIFRRDGAAIRSSTAISNHSCVGLNLSPSARRNATRQQAAAEKDWEAVMVNRVPRAPMSTAVRDRATPRESRFSEMATG